MSGSATHLHFMEAALENARAAAKIGEVPVGAVVVKGGEIIASGYNLRETLQDPTAHAELLALQRASAKLGTWRLQGCSLYVTLEPCAMCAGSIILSRLDACVYGASDPKGGYLGTLGDLSAVPALNHSFAVTPGVAAEESAKLLKAFFRGLRSKSQR